MAQPPSQALKRYFLTLFIGIVMLPSICSALKNEKEFFDFDPTQPENRGIQAQAKVCERNEEVLDIDSQPHYTSQFFERVKAEQIQDYSKQKGIKYLNPKQ